MVLQRGYKHLQAAYRELQVPRIIAESIFEPSLRHYRRILG